MSGDSKKYRVVVGAQVMRSTFAAPRELQNTVGLSLHFPDGIERFAMTVQMAQDVALALALARSVNLALHEEIDRRRAGGGVH